ncbi:vWA domain-containing protein [Desulfitobacterium sp.]|uniref:vWA domain-containing protein n=1 Tax=Desulfitobacterium sp. TaxID=49981 RepID=UPI002C2E913F|nr:VWA domain-containing protein [Desulfitobacterium sp.]HVJ48174.1 VWA domain-containing protein [Desulfitobacterium sp.]
MGEHVIKERSELDRHLLEFARLLREGGVPVSMTEVQDALQSLLKLGLEDKERTEGILQATLVKSPQNIPWFNEAFRAFFAPPEQQANWQNEAREKADNVHKGLSKSRKELSFQGEELNLTEEQRMVYLQLPEAEKERIKDFLTRSEQGIRNGIPVDHSFQPMVERVLRGSLEYWRHKLGEESEFPLSPPGEGGLLSEVERACREQEIQYFTRDLKNITPEEWPQVMQLIQQLSQRLAAQASRRYQARGKRGGIDMRHTLRENLRFGGVLLERRFRVKRRSRPKFVLLCDLSGSMMKYTEFILQFIYGLSSAVNGIETYAFADRLLELTGKVRSGHSLQAMLQAALPEASKEWGGGTNLAVSLEELAKKYAKSFSRNTVLIILSDTQTLEGERAAGLLKNIRRKVREILWLNTLPEKRWPETKTVEYFRPYCQMFECYTLGHLQNILSSRF